MKAAFRDSKGFYGTTWDGPTLSFNRTEIGPGETFEVISLDPVEPPVPPVIPTQPTLPPYAAWNGTPKDWFSQLVWNKPFGQQTLLELEPTLNANGWELTPPNAVGDRTKVLYPQGVWTRVGFGEGHWVWVPQSV